MLMFILFFNTIQNCFKHRFHADTLFPNEPIKAVQYCKIITICIELIYLYFCKNLNTSIYSNLGGIFFIALLNCLLEFYLKKSLIFVNRLNNKDELIKLCEIANISPIQTNRMVMKYIDKMTYQEIADKECLTMETVKNSLHRSREKIKEITLK